MNHDFCQALAASHTHLSAIAFSNQYGAFNRISFHFPFDIMLTMTMAMMQQAHISFSLIHPFCRPSKSTHWCATRASVCVHAHVYIEHTVLAVYLISSILFTEQIQHRKMRFCLWTCIFHAIAVPHCDSISIMYANEHKRNA